MNTRLRIARLVIVIVGLAAWFFGLFEVTAVLVLRAHYTMDVFAGAMTALFVGLIAEKIAMPVDRWLAGFASRS